MFKRLSTKFPFRFKRSLSIGGARRRPFRLTRSGWVFILYSIGLGAGAINTGNNLLYLLFGLFLGLILASGVLSDLSLWGLRPSLSFPSQVTAGKNCALAVRLVNTKKKIPSLSVTLVLEGDLEGRVVQLPIFVPSISGGSVFTGQFLWAPPVRGIFICRSLKLQTRFPFGLLVKWWTITPHVSEMLISPRRVSIQHSLEQYAAQFFQTSELRDARGESSVLRTLRSYMPSDSVRRIHWKASAKKNSSIDETSMSWLVKELEAERHHIVQLDWPLGKLASLEPEVFEEWVSFCASLVEDLDRRGRHVQLKVGTSLVTHYGAIMAFFSLVDLLRPERTQNLLRDFRTPMSRTGFDLSCLLRAKT